MKKLLYAAIVMLGLTGGGYAQTARANTVTIYFCGTGMTKAWWQAGAAQSPDGANGYWSPELVATLFKEQEENSHKFVVDGVGTDSAYGSDNLLDQGFPSSPLAGRGWAKCLDEAMAYLDSVLASASGEIKLNLVGHSRGGVLTLMAANRVKDNPRIKTVNILALDPVPGDSSLPAWTYSLGANVKNYVGIYAEDERTVMFEPVIPATGPGTRVRLLTLPGSHEAFTGNTQKDGHSRNNYFGARLTDGDAHLPELEPVAKLTKMIAAGLLASQDWGGLRFGRSQGQGTVEEFETEFLKTAREMRSAKAAELYEYQRTVSYLPSFSPVHTSLAELKDGVLRGVSYSAAQAGLQSGQRVVRKLEGGTLRAAALEEAVPGLETPWQLLNWLNETAD
jgi:pimeloyl-ACP methyl ester carboxylesterase